MYSYYILLLMLKIPDQFQYVNQLKMPLLFPKIDKISLNLKITVISTYNKQFPILSKSFVLIYVYCYYIRLKIRFIFFSD